MEGRPEIAVAAMTATLATGPNLKVQDPVNYRQCKKPHTISISSSKERRRKRVA